MKLFAMTAALVALSAPAFADPSAIERFNASKNNGDKIVSTAPSTRNGDSHSPKAQAIFDQIQAANAEDE